MVWPWSEVRQIQGFMRLSWNWLITYGLKRILNIIMGKGKGIAMVYLKAKYLQIYCWPTISTFWGISLCCCCVLLKKVNNILLVLCWCKWKRAILCWCWFVHIDPYIVKHIGDNLSRIWTSLNAQFGKNKSHCPEGLIYSAIFNVNQSRIFRTCLLIVFCWIWNTIVRLI